jgi:glycosyltransferase involved in cell wall biosynthesis
MKLLFINTLYAPHIGGGAEVILREHVQEFQRRGHRVAVLATGPDAGCQVEDVDGIRVYRAGIRNLYWTHGGSRAGRLSRLRWHWKDRYNRQMRSYVRQAIEDLSPDLVVCHNLSGWSIAAWDEVVQARLPIVQVLHDLYLACPNANMFKGGRACEQQCGLCKAFRASHATASQRLSAVVGVSGYVLRRLEGLGYFRDVKTTVIHNARQIDDPGYSPRPAGERLRVGYIGTLSQSKGLEWLLEQFHGQPGEAELVIAGKGEPGYESHLRAIADPRRVRFAGYVDPKAFFATIDVCVVPSIWPDTFPGVAYEACAHHVPVIGSRIGGIPEIVQEGINGLFCDPLQPQTLGAALSRLSQDRALLNRLSTQARKSVAPLLDPQRMYGQYGDLYAAVCGAGP